MEQIGGVITPLESVTVSGQAQEGETLSASVSPAGATVSYQWMQSKDEPEGYENIEGATAETFVLTSQQVGKTVVCECSGTGKYSGTKTSAATQPVTAAGG